MWKKIAVLVVVGLLPISAVAHTRLFYRASYRSDYRKAEIVTPEATEMPTAEQTGTPLVEIRLESTLTPELTLTPEPTEMPTESPTPTPTVEIIDAEDAVDTTDQITTPSDVDTPTTPAELL